MANKEKAGERLRFHEVRMDGRTTLRPPKEAIERALNKAFRAYGEKPLWRNFYRAVEKNVIKPAVALALEEEKARVRPYLEDAIEILTNAQGEWAVVTETYAPLEHHPLKESISLIAEALAGKGRKAAEEKALSLARISFVYDEKRKIKGVLVPNFGEDGQSVFRIFEPDEYKEVNP